MVLLRLLCALLLGLSASGCAVMYELLVPAQSRRSQESAEVKKLTTEAWKTKDCEAGVSELNRVASKARVRTELGKHLTPYGEEVKRWWMLCAQQAHQAATSKDADPLIGLERGVHLAGLALSLPTAQLGLVDKGPNAADDIGKAEELSVARVTALRLGFSERLTATQAQRAAQLAEAQRLVALAEAAEHEGLQLAALAAWQSTQPADDAGRTQREQALRRVGPLALAQLAVPVAVLAAQTNGADPEVLSAVRGDAALRARVDLHLVEDPAAATVVLRLGVGEVSRAQRQETVRQQHTWVSGRQTVANPAIESARKQLAYHEKEAVYWRKSASNVRCRGEPCKTRISALNNVKREEDAAARERNRLSHEKPTVVREVTAVHDFAATRTVVTGTCSVSATPTLRGGAPGAPSEGVARVERSGLAFAAEPRVGLAARADALPSAEELARLVREAAAHELAGRVAQAPALAAGEYDARLAAATTPLEKLQYAALKALRSNQPADLDAARTSASAALRAEPDWAALRAALKQAPLAVR